MEVRPNGTVPERSCIRHSRQIDRGSSLQGIASATATAWYGPRDIALIRVSRAIPIFDVNGDRIPEFRRPIYIGNPREVSAPTSAFSMELYSKNAFCGQGDGVLRCDTLSNLWWSPNFRNQFFQLPFGAWEHNGRFEGGDDGAPLLKYALD
jgi:hypothetical protein